MEQNDITPNDYESFVKKLNEKANEFSIKVDNSKSCFVYLLLLNDEVVYVGQTTQGLARPFSHINSKEFDEVRVIGCQTESLNMVEAAMIAYHKPYYNNSIPGNSILVGKETLKKMFCIGGRELNTIIRQNKIEPRYDGSYFFVGDFYAER